MPSRMFSLGFVLACSLASTLAMADEATLSDKARMRVEEELQKPLAQRRPRFSRRSPPPSEYRTRILQQAPMLDASGKRFFPFAIDAKSQQSERLEEGLITGCVYPESGQIFVKLGSDANAEWRPAAFLLGKPADPVPLVCRASAPKA